jgi:UDP-3-O-[3-hydroxymyristoyl] glucosamine N-acyltransferase
MKKIKVSEIANFINKPFGGHDFYIDNVSTVSELNKNSIIFCLNNKYLDNKKFSKILIICKKKFNIAHNDYLAFILSENPKLDFSRILNNFFIKTKNKIENTSIINKKSKLSKNVSVGHYSIIAENVEIGEGTSIGNHVVIAKNSKIGKDCIIKSGAIIGETGFGFAFDEKKSF